jgi:hypothetical protein
MHPGATLDHLEFTKSDHRPLLLDTEGHVINQGRRPRTKRFEASWLQEKDFQERVQRAWESASAADPTGDVLSKLSRLHGELHDWNNKVLRKPQKRIRQAQIRFDEAMSGPMTAEKEEIAKEMKALIDLLLEQEETHWMQRSRANWLRQGDWNTSFFHNYATARRKKNFIKKLKGDADQWVEGTEALKPLIFQYFSNLFSSEVNELDPEVLEKIQPRVSQEMNEKLLAPFSVEDVKKAAFSIGDFKAPGPDGLHAVFYNFFLEYVWRGNHT